MESHLLTKEQQELHQILQDFFTREIGSEYLRKRVRDKQAVDLALWGKFAELDLFQFFGGEGSLGSEGADGAFRDLALIAFEGGRVLNPENLSEALLAGPFLGRYLNCEKFQPFRSGDERLCVAHGDPTVVHIDPNNCVSGSVPFVNGVASSSAVLLHLPVETEIPRATERLLLVSLNAGGLITELEESLDLTQASHQLTFASTAAMELSLAARAPAFSRMLALLKAAELCGIGERVVQMTAEYVKTRQQFGVPVGGFQAVQHQLADMYAHVAAAKALVIFAAWAIDVSPDQAALASRSAITYACEVLPPAVERAIQLHGGMGFTWEYDLHLFLRRAKRIEALWASEEAEFDDLLRLAAQA